MLTTGIFTTHNLSIALPNPSDEFKLIIFGDVHRDSPNHAERAWKEFLAYTRGLDPDRTVYLGMGDYLDNASTSERKILCNNDLHETSKRDMESIADTKVGRLAKELDHMKGRLIGLLGGNHYWQYASGMTSDHKLCERLGCKFLGVSSFIRLTIGAINSNTRQKLDIWCHHGKGGGRLLGTSLNTVDQMREHAEADVYIMGHDHKRLVVPAMPRLTLRGKGSKISVHHRQQWLVRSGSYLASYEPGVQNYNVDAGRGPSSIGHCELWIKPKFTHGRLVSGFEIRGVA